MPSLLLVRDTSTETRSAGDDTAIAASGRHEQEEKLYFQEKDKSSPANEDFHQRFDSNINRYGPSSMQMNQNTAPSITGSESNMPVPDFNYIPTTAPAPAYGGEQKQDQGIVLFPHTGIVSMTELELMRHHMNTNNMYGNDITAFHQQPHFPYFEQHQQEQLYPPSILAGKELVRQKEQELAFLYQTQSEQLAMSQLAFHRDLDASIAIQYQPNYMRSAGVIPNYRLSALEQTMRTGVLLKNDMSAVPSIYKRNMHEQNFYASSSQVGGGGKKRSFDLNTTTHADHVFTDLNNKKARCVSIENKSFPSQIKSEILISAPTTIIAPRINNVSHDDSQSPGLLDNATPDDVKEKKKISLKEHLKAFETSLQAEKPRKPLTAYNFFFSEERERILAHLPSPKAVSLKDNKTQALAEIKRKLEGGTSKLSGKEEKDLTERIKEKTEKILSTHLDGQRKKRSHKKDHGKISFKTLCKLVGDRWKLLPDEERKKYQNFSKRDSERYRREMNRFVQAKKSIVQSHLDEGSS